MFSCTIGWLLDNKLTETAFLFHLGCKESSSPTSSPAAAQFSHCSSTTTHRLFSRGCNGPCARSLCSTYKPLLWQMLSCPVRCLAALCCTPVAGGGRTWKHSKHCCVLRPRHPHFHPQPFFSNPRWVLPHCRCHSENCDAGYFPALDLVQASCILLRLQQGRHKVCGK